MRKFVVVLFVVALLAIALPVSVQADDGPDNDCWGQLTAWYTQEYGMGEHASSEETPRYGLPNLARELAKGDDPVLDEGTLQALGAFLNAALGYPVEACGQ